MNPITTLRSASAEFACSLMRGWAVSPVTVTPGVVAAHVDRCPVCGTEVEREHVLEEALSSLSGETEPAPRWLTNAVLAEIDRPALVLAEQATTGTGPRGTGWRVTLERNRRVAAASASAMALGVALAATLRSRAVAA